MTQWRYTRSIRRGAVRQGLVLGLGLITALGLLLWTPPLAHAHGGPQFTETAAAGPYVVDISLDSYPPITDQYVDLTVWPHQRDLRLSGSVIITPGLGTDAVPLHAPLTWDTQYAELAGTIHIPTRGSWNLVIHLDGPKGAGVATVPIVVGGPGAIPIWLGWLIGLTPIYGFLGLTVFQIRYRRALAARQARRVASDGVAAGVPADSPAG